MAQLSHNPIDEIATTVESFGTRDPSLGGGFRTLNGRILVRRPFGGSDPPGDGSRRHYGVLPSFLPFVLT
jgi:hypothetical protein